MTHILKIDDFIKESRGAALSARTPDRFNSDPLDKWTNTVYDKQIEKNEKIIDQIGADAVSVCDWLCYDVVYDDSGYNYGEGFVDLYLYIMYFQKTLISFDDFGINLEKCTPSQLNYLKHIKQIEINEESNSFMFKIHEYKDEFNDFVYKRTIGKGIYTFNYWSNQANMGPSLPDLTDIGIVCMFDNDDEKQGMVNKQKMTQLANRAVNLWMEYFNSLFKRIIM